MNKDTIVEERKIPEGYEVDVENSTLFRVVFKKMENTELQVIPEKVKK